MTSITKSAPSNHTAEDRAARIAAAQTLLFDLVEREAEANAFKHGPRGPDRSFFLGTNTKTHINTVDLTIEGPRGLTLDFEAIHPAEHLIPEDNCTVAVGVFHNKRYKLAEKLEDHVFLPIVTDQRLVSWQGPDGPSFTPQQLRDFAFQRLREHTERC
jgi:hypothetical protein